MRHCKWLFSVFIILVMGCTRTPNPKFSIGSKILVKKGFFIGCSGTILGYAHFRQIHYIFNVMRCPNNIIVYKQLIKEEDL